MKSKNRILPVVVFGLALYLLAGGAEVQQNWVKHCQKCHGADGSGKTAAGKKLKVLDYTDPAVQAEITDEEIVQVTTEGVKDDAGKTRMPGYADKLSEEEIQAFVAYIRSLVKE